MASWESRTCPFLFLDCIMYPAEISCQLHCWHVPILGEAVEAEEIPMFSEEIRNQMQTVWIFCLLLDHLSIFLDRSHSFKNISEVQDYSVLCSFLWVDNGWHPIPSFRNSGCLEMFHRLAHLWQYVDFPISLLTSSPCCFQEYVDMSYLQDVFLHLFWMNHILILRNTLLIEDGVLSRIFFLLFSRMRSEVFSFYFGGLGIEACSTLLLCLRPYCWRFQTSRNIVSCGRRGTSWHVSWRVQRLGVTGAILVRWCHKTRCILCGRCNILDVSCCMFCANRIVSAASGADNMQMAWQAWDIVRVSFCLAAAAWNAILRCRRSLECTVWSVKCRVRSVQCEV